jgi:hypothetical protein
MSRLYIFETGGAADAGDAIPASNTAAMKKRKAMRMEVISDPPADRASVSGRGGMRAVALCGRNSYNPSRAKLPIRDFSVAAMSFKKTTIRIHPQPLTLLRRVFKPARRE